MLKKISDALFLSPDDRRMKAYSRQVDAINALEPEIHSLDDDGLKSRARTLRDKAANGSNLDDLLPEAFALVREAAQRVIGQRHYDVQLVGGMILNDGMLAEMRTGEGKTLVATLAAFLNALPGKGVHVVTANDYLARRDHDTMGPIHRLLGLTVGHVGPDTSPDDRRSAYASDIVYTTNSQVGFDYLRDGLVLDRAEMVHRPFNYAIVDEVDSILIDEARTPLVISGAAEDKSSIYSAIDRFAVRIPSNEVEFDDKERTVVLSDAGLTRIETMLTSAGLLKAETHLHDPEQADLLHHVTAALRAHHMFKRDQHYVVQDGEVLLVDEFTGRTLPGRRLNEGIHQAIEAKERVPINPESDTVASITLQNLFRIYPKLSGMTGTAMTEAGEFADIYGLGVLRVPTHKPVIRKDLADMIYRTHAEKIAAVVKAVDEAHGRLQPVLIGTASIEGSEEIATALEDAGYTRIDFDDAHALDPVYAAAESGQPAKRFAVLNARHNRQEAYAISQAGVPGAIMVATNMAGRGTDIQLGGDPTMRIERETATLDPEATATRRQQILEQTRRFAKTARAAGGLFVVGTERHESRRIDNQLRGRSGRQGDPGRSQFFLAFTDPVIRRFGKLDFLADQMELQPGEAISHRLITGAVDKAQAKQEAHNFEIRKTVLKFDDVVNEQRKAVANERSKLLDAEDVSELVTEMRELWIEDLVDTTMPKGTYPEQWDGDRLSSEIQRVLQIEAPVKAWFEEEGIDPQEVEKRIRAMANGAFAARAEIYGPRFAKDVEQRYALLILDMAWREMIAELDHLKQAVGWRAIGQRDPITEFRVEAAEGFQRMIDRWHELVTLETMRPRAVEAVAA